MMTERKIREAVAEARRFIAASKAALVAIDEEWSLRCGDDFNSEQKRGGYRYSSGSRATGKLRRASLDLSAALAEMRR